MLVSQLLKDSDNFALWEQKILNELGNEYFKVYNYFHLFQLFIVFSQMASKQLFGLTLSIFARKSFRKRLSLTTQIQTVSCGIIRLVANKGAIGMSFCVDNHPICIVASHLTSGRGIYNILFLFSFHFF